MTIATTTTVILYDGNDSATTFSFPFHVDSDDEVKAVLVSAGGTSTPLVLDTDYSVTGVGVEGDGEVTYPLSGDPLATGEQLTIYRETERKQLTAFTSQGTFRAANHEAAFDKITKMVQEHEEALTRAAKTGIGSGETGDDLITAINDAEAAAEAAQVGAQAAQSAAETAQGLAEAAQSAAEVAQGLAETAQTGAETAQGLAEAAQAAAEGAAASALVQWRFGTGAPAGGLGIDGDNYMDTDTDEYYHKESGSWVLKGDCTGATGAPGSNGAAGANGATVIYGSGAPSNGTGNNGDTYIDGASWTVYGPKAAGAWPAGQSMVGPAGAGSGDVSGPGSAVNGNVVSFSGTTGKLVADSGIAASSLLHGSTGTAAYYPILTTTTAGAFQVGGIALDAGGRVVAAGGMSFSATDKLAGRSSSGAGASEEISCTAAGRALLDDADAAAQRTTLGLYTTEIDLPASDHVATGLRESGTAGETVAIGELLYMKSDGKWWKADADASTSMPGLRLALEAKNADEACKLLVFGAMRDDSWNWTVGGLIYASTTAGGLTQTAPSGTGDQVQVVGIAYHADKMLFCPSPVLGEVK